MHVVSAFLLVDVTLMFLLHWALECLKIFLDLTCELMCLKILLTIAHASVLVTIYVR
jgi:hypothetical protein